MAEMERRTFGSLNAIASRRWHGDRKLEHNRSVGRLRRTRLHHSDGNHVPRSLLPLRAGTQLERTDSSAARLAASREVITSCCRLSFTHTFYSCGFARGNMRLRDG